MSIQNFIQQLEYVNKNPKKLIHNYTTLINQPSHFNSLSGQSSNVLFGKYLLIIKGILFSLNSLSAIIMGS